MNRNSVGQLLVVACLGLAGLAVADDAEEDRAAIQAAEANYQKAAQRGQLSRTKSYVEDLHSLSRNLLLAELRAYKDQEHCVEACTRYLKREHRWVSPNSKQSK
jgi:hypothetical protein